MCSNECVREKNRQNLLDTKGFQEQYDSYEKYIAVPNDSDNQLSASFGQQV